MRRFNAIPVVPPRELYFGGMLVDGGPIWPDFETRGPVRFNRHKPVDRAPHPYPGPHAAVRQPCVWGGFIQHHFGHLIADHLTRIVESIAERPDDLFLFVTYPGGDARDLPGYFWSIIDWYGLPRSQVKVVTEPTMVAELRCAPQAERLDRAGPPDHYLGLLDTIMRRNGLVPKPNDILFVTRAGQLQKGKGAHAGEGYLVRVLRSLGVSVLDPAQASLTDQLASYAGASTVVFSEGSAMHGRQLLGKIAQDVVVLRRRIGKSLARDVLIPRCKTLRYVDVGSRFAAPISADGRLLDAEGISFYDTDALFAAFADLGLDLKRHWSEAEFLAVRALEVAAWLDYSGRHGRLSHESLAALSGTFDAVGLDTIRTASGLRRLNWHTRSLLLKNVGKIVKKRKPWSN